MIFLLSPFAIFRSNDFTSQTKAIDPAATIVKIQPVMCPIGGGAQACFSSIPSGEFRGYIRKPGKYLGLVSTVQMYSRKIIITGTERSEMVALVVAQLSITESILKR